MRKSLVLMLVCSVIFSFFIMQSTSAAACELSVKMVNQDPYPAIPGDYVKTVFQLDGVENPECGNVYIELKEEYPITFDPDQSSRYELNSGTYERDFGSFFLATYKVRVDDDALEGDNPIEIAYGKVGGAELLKKFDLYVEDARADFEVFVKNYDHATNTLTLEVLNIAENDVEGLTLEISKQENIEVTGSKTNIIGSLDSNEYTTADFSAIPSEGDINLTIHYTDQTNTRRTLEKTISFEPDYFPEVKKGISTGTIIFWIVIIAIIAYFVYKRIQKKKHKAAHHHHPEHH